LRRFVLLALIASSGGALIYSLPSATAATRATGTVIGVHSTKKFGKFLVDMNHRGFTVYAYSKDTRNTDNCQKNPQCTSLWPAVTTQGKPVAGPGVKQSLLHTITLKNGKHQVTYNGHPLYTYIGDSSPHSTFYINFFQAGGFWPAVSPSGKLIK
jgi:predicted lipoprotein with Yx(FWY)xxD motif